MRVLAACEESGRIRDAFIAHGHDAWSADLRPGRGKHKSRHYEGDLVDTLRWEDPFDLLIACPPCTHLSGSGARWWPEKQRDGRQREGLRFARWLIEYEFCPRVCVENPVGLLSTAVRKPEQIIQPWQFWHLDKPGAGEVKTTCLWLKNLPLLVPTTPDETGRYQACWRMPPGADRAQLRSVTYRGIADAMAEQWGGLPPLEL